jgi:hypothetical protein
MLRRFRSSWFLCSGRHSRLKVLAAWSFSSTATAIGRSVAGHRFISSSGSWRKALLLLGSVCLGICLLEGLKRGFRPGIAKWVTLCSRSRSCTSSTTRSGVESLPSMRTSHIRKAPESISPCLPIILLFLPLLLTGTRMRRIPSSTG